jgi:hypothetical protein
MVSISHLFGRRRSLLAAVGTRGQCPLRLVIRLRLVSQSREGRGWFTLCCRTVPLGRRWPAGRHETRNSATFVSSRVRIFLDDVGGPRIGRGLAQPRRRPVKYQYRSRRPAQARPEFPVTGAGECPGLRVVQRAVLQEANSSQTDCTRAVHGRWSRNHPHLRAGTINRPSFLQQSFRHIHSWPANRFADQACASWRSSGYRSRALRPAS